MRSFFTQLGWEMRRLVMRPQTWLAFVLSFVFELGASFLLKVPSVRAGIALDVWKMRANWNEVFSGLTVAFHIMDESFSVLGALGLSLVAAGIVGGEKEDGTLQMVFCRPVHRTVVLAQKWIVCVVYSALLAGFIAGSTLVICMISEGKGNLVLVAPHESVVGAFTFHEGMRRFALAIPLMWFSGVSGMLWPLFFSCTSMKPAAAIILALALFATDDLIRTSPETSVASPYCMTTRMISWRQVFNDDIPWPRIERNYQQIAEMDVALIIAAGLAFRRQEFKR